MELAGDPMPFLDDRQCAGLGFESVMVERQCCLAGEGLEEAEVVGVEIGV